MATSSPSVTGLAATTTRSTPVINQLLFYTDESIPVSSITTDTVGYEVDTFRWFYTKFDDIINKPEVAYKPKFFSAQFAISQGSFNFGDPSKGPISVRYKEIFTESDDDNPRDWQTSQDRYNSQLLEWHNGMDWIQRDETMQALSDIYKYWAFKRLGVEFRSVGAAFLLTLGDVILVKNVSPRLLPSSFGHGIGDDGKKFQVIAHEKDYMNGLVTIRAIDADREQLL